MTAPRNQFFDASFAWSWILGFGLTVYLGMEGGGFDSLISGQVGVLVWWVLLFAVAVGALPRRRPTTIAWTALGILACFVAWTALSLIWTESTEKTLTDFARVATYLGVFGLGLFTRGPRSARHTVSAIGAAIAVLGVVALLSRLHPAWFPSARQTGNFLQTGRERLSYPVNYWNALAALLAIGMPLLLWSATCARTTVARAFAAASLPALVLAAYFTLSRGGIAAAAIGLALFLILTPDRIPKAVTLLFAAVGGGILVAMAGARDALTHGRATDLAHHQGTQVLLATLAVCVVVGLLQAAFSALLERRGRPRWSVVSPRAARTVAIALVAVLVVGVVAVAASGKASRAWNDFKRPNSGPGHGSTRLNSVAGESRYQFWSSAYREFEHRPLTGTGSGTFQLWWTRDGDYEENIVDAHSLYLQTLGELGLVGLALLAAFIALSLVVGTRAVLRARVESKPVLAAALAGSTAIWLTSIFDWTWKVPVLPVASLLLIAVLVAARSRSREREVEAGAETAGFAEEESTRAGLPLPARAGAALAAAAAIVGIAIPLASTSLVRSSQSAARAGNVSAALADARSAQNVEPGAAGPRLQQALVLETAGDYEAAAAAATAAADSESTNWRIWLVLSRIEAERGNSDAAVSDYRRARSLNPTDSLFHRQ
ncbi:MAG TPA: O-antigen ligase family protein [Solirubrobacterales bacterium]